MRSTNPQEPKQFFLVEDKNIEEIVASVSAYAASNSAPTASPLAISSVNQAQTKAQAIHQSFTTLRKGRIASYFYYYVAEQNTGKM
jgi:hypothetical protein